MSDHSRAESRGPCFDCVVNQMKKPTGRCDTSVAVIVFSIGCISMLDGLLRHLNTEGREWYFALLDEALGIVLLAAAVLHAQSGSEMRRRFRVALGAWVMLMAIAWTGLLIGQLRGTTSWESARDRANECLGATGDRAMDVCRAASLDCGKIQNLSEEDSRTCSEVLDRLIQLAREKAHSGQLSDDFP